MPNTNAAMGFPRIPGKPMPEHLQRPLIGYDLGSHFNYKDGSGYLTAVPVVEKEFPQLVVKVDADGNEVAGLKSPLRDGAARDLHGLECDESRARSRDSCAATCRRADSSRSRRRKRSGPRPGIRACRSRSATGSHEGYVQAVTAAANTLVKDGLLLSRDADTMIAQAQNSDILK